MARRSKRPVRARWKAKERGVPNGLEKRHYDEQIAPKLATGEYAWAGYECWSFALTENGKRAVYTPDWVVLQSDGAISIHEVKGGRYMGDSRLRLRLAADKYNFFDWRAFVYSGKKPPKVEEL